LTITVLSKPNCVQCNATYRALENKGIDYEVVDMTKDESALARAKSLGHLSAPVVIVGEDSWSGFRPDLIDGLVK